MIKIRIKCLNSSSIQHIFPFDPINKQISTEYPILRFFCLNNYNINYINIILLHNYKMKLNKIWLFLLSHFGFSKLIRIFPLQYFTFLISIVNAHISKNQYVSNKINFFKIKTSKEISTFLTSYFRIKLFFN